MQRWWFYVVVLLVFAGCATMTPSVDKGPRDFKVVGYLPEYEWKNTPVTVGRHLTDVILFSLEPRTDGTLDAARATPEFVAMVQEMKRSYGTRVLVCLGGWGRSTGFGAMATDVEKRRRFVSELTRFCVDNGFDAQSATCAPPSRKVRIRLAVSVVTCRQQPMRLPLNGLVFLNRSRMSFNTGILASAQSILLLPSGARFLSRILYFITLPFFILSPPHALLHRPCRKVPR